jgi:hypothetical protein
MNTKTITIRVSAELADMFESASESERRKLEALMALKLEDATRSQRNLLDVMTDISNNAQATGVTPEILDSILNDDDT